jgi:hypothetical protein
MPTSVTAEPAYEVGATGVRFEGERLVVVLDDGRELSIDTADVPWLGFLRDASHKARRNWTIEPGGFAIYWPELDDGLEVCHLLSTSRIA